MKKKRSQKKRVIATILTIEWMANSLSGVSWASLSLCPLWMVLWLWCLGLYFRVIEQQSESEERRNRKWRWPLEGNSGHCYQFVPSLTHIFCYWPHLDQRFLLSNHRIILNLLQQPSIEGVRNTSCIWKSINGCKREEKPSKREKQTILQEEERRKKRKQTRRRKRFPKERRNSFSIHFLVIQVLPSSVCLIPFKYH